VTDVLDEAIAGNGLVSAFQQVVALPSQIVVGYEALARWPKLNNPAPIDVFAHAAKTGRLNVLDHACIRAAVQGALRGSSTPGMLLLLNCEPATTHIDAAADLDVMRAAACFRLTFEVTERGLLRNPRALLRKVAALRSLGFAIALDDVGSDPDSLALLDVVAPDMLKLDMGLTHRQPDRMQARTVAAIIAHHERTGALICAEGIETDDHLEQALAYGATLGQGMRFGAPGELTTPTHVFSWPARTTHPPTVAHLSTFDLATAVLTARTVRKQTLNELFRQIERIAVAADNPPIVLTTLQKCEDPPGATKTKYSAIAERSPLVAIFGENLPGELGPGVRGVKLDSNDPLSRESTIVVLGPDTAAALIARERRCPASISDDTENRRFDMVVTFDRECVTAAARNLLDRLI
jgi:EAL domain-containing protein (putative c-di-GMP-specific phosphodiesterase class I)